MSIKSTLQLILITIFLLGCTSQEEFVVSSPTVTSTIAPGVAQTQLAMPITTATFDSVQRISNDFLPPPTPLPSATPTNVFLPVSDTDGYRDLVIEMERLGCFGPSCPAYSLTIKGDGTGVYEGRFNVKIEGIRNFTLSGKQLAELVLSFDTFHFFSLEDGYSVGITDSTYTITSIKFQGYSKVVLHNGGCWDYETNPLLPNEQPTYIYIAPQALCDLENKIDEIVNISRWTGKE
jgi:hypothetical protein